MPALRGKIAAVSHKKTKTGKDTTDIRIGNNDWYSSFGAHDWQKGQEVEIEYEVSGDQDQFRNIKSLKIIGPELPPTEPTATAPSPNGTDGKRTPIRPTIDQALSCLYQFHEAAYKLEPDSPEARAAIVNTMMIGMFQRNIDISHTESES